MISAFISYAHSDEKLKDQLLTHLAALRREGLIGVWHDRMLKPGEHLDQAIETQLAASDLIILLISPAFIASDYCAETEMLRAFQRAQSGKAKVVAFILRPCRWHNLPLLDGLKLGDFVAVPRDGKAVISWSVLDEAFDDGVGKIRDLIVDESSNVLAAGAADPASRQLPSSSAQVSGNASAKGRSPHRTSSLKLPRRFTDLDRDTFVDDAFESIVLGFKNNLASLERENEGIRTRFQRVDGHCFVATVYANGDMVGGAKVFRGGTSRHDSSIYLSYDLSVGVSSWNEWLSVENDGERIFFKAAGMPQLTGFDSAEKQGLSPERAANYLWEVMMSQISARLR